MAKNKLDIQEGRVAAFYYTVSDEDGKVLDSNRRGGQPTAFLCGAGNIVPGLEKQLVGKVKDDHVEVQVAPEEAYGAWKDELVREIPRESFPADMDLQAGMMVNGTDPSGRRVAARIREVGDETVTVDENHPLAGMTLTFAVTITGVREANESEKAHRHPHGPGGHHH